MKLVAIMSLDAYREDLHQTYRDYEVRVFSELDIRGYHHETPLPATDVGWFGGTDTSAYSTLTWAFLPEEKATELLGAIEKYNDVHDLDHPVRAFQMPVDRSV